MSTVAEQPSVPARWRERLAPRDDDGGGGRRGRLYRAETVVLALVALVFTVATVYDLARTVHISNRFHADLASWTAITGRRDRHAIIEQDSKTYTTRDIVCGRAASTASVPAEVCLIFQGPVKDGRRNAFGGYYVLKGGRRKNLVKDVASRRYACFGDAIAQGFRCLATAPPGAPDKPL